MLPLTRKLYELTIGKNMIFNDGMTDNIAASVLNSIEWKFRYNVLQGSCKDSPAFSQVIPNGNKDSGEFEIEASAISGGQKSTISWYKDEGIVRFRIIEITRPQ